jgi:hypothetical protein
MTDKEPKALSEQLTEKLKGYSTLSKLARAAGAGVIGGAAVTAPLFVAEPTDSAIIHKDIVNVMLSGTNGTLSLDIDDGGADLRFRLLFSVSTSSTLAFASGLGGGSAGVYHDGFLRLRNFLSGSSIDAYPFSGPWNPYRSAYISRYNSIYENWLYGGFMGFRLANGNKGWLRLDFDRLGGPGRRRKITIFEYAFEDSGGAIKAGETGTPIPEPGTLATLTLGAMGLLAWRRHRQKQAQKANAEKDG